MVKITNFIKRTTEEGKEFFVLEIQGGIEMVKSQETGKFYVTARKTTISSTFDEMTCQSLLGKELPGRIEKVDCEEYDYTDKKTGQIITLTHRLEYVEENAVPKTEKSATTIEEFMNAAPAGNSFSTNGQLVH